MRLDEARVLYDAQVEGLTKLTVSPDAVVSDQKDLETTHAELVAETSALLDKYKEARDITLAALAAAGPHCCDGVSSIQVWLNRSPEPNPKWTPLRPERIT